MPRRLRNRRRPALRLNELDLNDKLIGDRKRLQSSDAHHLGDIMEAVFDLPTDRFSLGGLFDYVSGKA